MKKFFYLFLLPLCLGLGACGGDSDGESGTTTPPSSPEEEEKDIINNLISHKWEGSETEYSEYSYGSSVYTQTWTVYFIDENKGVIHWVTTDKDSSLGFSRDEGHSDFSYSITGNTIQLSGDSNFCFDYYGDFMMEGDDMFTPQKMNQDDYQYLEDHKNGYHGVKGPIDSEIYMNDAEDMLVDARYITDPSYRSSLRNTYCYTLKLAFGTNDGNAYRKGMEQIRLTIWSDDAAIDVNYLFYGYSYRKKYTLYLSEGIKDYKEVIYAHSRNTEITIHYELEYYNSTDKTWYNSMSKELTFKVKD